MKVENLLLDIYKFIPSLLSFHHGRKPNILRAFVFKVGKKLRLKDIPIECIYSIVNHEIGFTIISGNPLRMNLNDFELRTRILFVDMKIKLLGNCQAENSKEFVEKTIEKSTGHRR